MAAGAGLTTAGLVTFGLVSFHLVTRDLVPTAGVPLLYAGAMASGVVAALVTGEAYDRIGGRVLLVLPFLVATVPVLAFADSLTPVVAGVLLWGAAVGLQDSGVGEEDTYVIVALGVRSPDGVPTFVAVARSLESVNASISALRALLLTGVPLLVLFVGGATFVLAGRALRPVEAIRRRVAGIGAEQLGKRVPVPSAQDEVGRLAVTMNDMLDRLESSATSQRRCVSDASHELRSPLATVRTSMEVAQVHPEITDWPDLTQVVLNETARRQTLVTDMLLLARSDERGMQLRRTEVDLDDVCEQEAARLRRTGLRVLTDINAARTVGDPDGLARALRNLADNAARHANAVVWLSLHVEGLTAVLQVGDDGPGMCVEQRERVFERFVRLDESRTRASGGTGLGLPIVRQIVRAHAGTVSFVDGALGGAYARVVLPLPPE